MVKGMVSNFLVLCMLFKNCTPPPCLSFGNSPYSTSWNSLILQSILVMITRFSPRPARINAFLAIVVVGTFSSSVSDRQKKLWVQVNVLNLLAWVAGETVLRLFPKLWRCSAATEVFLASLSKLMALL